MSILLEEETVINFNTPDVGKVVMVLDDITGELSVKKSNGNTVSLEAGGAAIIADVVTFEAKVNEIAGIDKGEIVFISGSSGSKILISLADNATFSKSFVIAISTEIVANNADGIFQSFGLLENLDTTSFGSPSDILYLGSNGAITNVHPTGTDAVIRVGYLVRSHASQGSIFVDITSQTIANNHNGTVRHQLVNENTGAASASSYTLVNDAGHRASFSLFGNNTFEPDAVTFYNQGYGLTAYTNDGNTDFLWLTDTTDTHNFISTEKMRLSAAGALTVQGLVNGRDIAADGTAQDTHIADVTLHRTINDAGTSVTELWSADKINSEISGAIAGVHRNAGPYNASTNTPDLDTSPSGILSGDSYHVTVAGVFFTEDVIAGDFLIAEQDNPTLLSHWSRINKNFDDVLLPSLGEKEALTGTGTPSSSNKYVTNDDSRLTDARTPVAHNHLASDVTDFDTEVSNNISVSANTTHKTSDGSDHAFINQDVTTAADVLFNKVTVGDVTDGAGQDYIEFSHLDNVWKTRINTFGTFIIKDETGDNNILLIESGSVDESITIAPTIITLNNNVEVSGQVYSTAATTVNSGISTATIDFNNGNSTAINLAAATSDVTLTLNNAKDGASYQITTLQHATTPVNIIFPSNVLFNNGATAPHTITLSTASAAVDTITLTKYSFGFIAAIGRDFK